jgi:DNA-binding CsgD family transcriptional regulator
MMTSLLTWDVKSLQKINLIPQYWESLKPKKNIGALLEDSWKKKIEFIDEISVQNNVVVFLWNAYTNRFLYMSDKLKVLSGLDPSLYIAENGMEYSLSRAHPNHIAPTLDLNRKFISYCLENNVTDYRTVSVCFNYLYKNGNDQYVQILQRAVILEVDENNKPSLALSFIHYIGHIKKHDSVGGVICAGDGVSIFDYNVDKKCFEPVKTVSDQEKKILQMLAQGLDTKAIAKNLSISPHTVNTHRRNLIKKTSCVDTTGVVDFAKLIGLI